MCAAMCMHLCMRGVGWGISVKLSYVFACTCACARTCLFACYSRQVSVSSIVGIVRLVVHDQSAVHKVEAVRPGLVRALHHLTH